MNRGGSEVVGVRDWTRRLTLCVVLITCIGGGAYQLIEPRRDDCTVVADMMRTYIAYLDRTAGFGRTVDPVAVAAAEATAAGRLQRMAGDIDSAPLRAHAEQFAGALAASARIDSDRAARPVELDPFQAILPDVDPGQLELDERLFASAHVLLTACPAAPRPYGLS